MLVGLLDEADVFNEPAGRALRVARSRGALIIAAPVYVELCAMPITTKGWDLDGFLKAVGIRIDWEFEETLWRLAGRANGIYVAQRRKDAKLPRRIAADFLIGAHALARGAELLTFDQRTFKAAFPALKVVEP